MKESVAAVCQSRVVGETGSEAAVGLFCIPGLALGVAAEVKHRQI